MKGEDVMVVVTAIAKLACVLMVSYIGVSELDRYVVTDDDKSE